MSHQHDPGDPLSAPTTPPGSADADGPDPPKAGGADADAGQGLLATAVGVLVAPTTTLRHVTARPRIGWALSVAVGVLVLTSIASAAGGAAVTPGPFGGVGGRAAAVAGAVAGPLVGLGALALGALIVLGAARLLGGSASYAATFCGMAFALLPWAATVLLSLLGAAGGLPGQAVAGALTLAVAVWATALAVLAVRSAHALSTGRAMIAIAAQVMVPAALFGLPLALGLVVLVAVVAFL